VIAELSVTLAAEDISIFVVSTHDTDYFLVKDEDLSKAVVTLEAEGHDIGTM
jgi:hypothetical protein